MTQDDGGYDLKNHPPQQAGVPVDGAAAPAAPKPGEPGWIPPVPVIEKADDAEGALTPEEMADAADVGKHKGIAAVGYVFFMIPLVAAPNSKFARYHANQSLLLFILFVAVVISVTALHVAEYLNEKFMTIGILAWFFSCGLVLLQIAFLVGWGVLWIMGIINAANGEKKPLPVVGHWTLIK